MDKLKEQYLSWHDLTIGIWAALLALGFSIFRFLRWFSTREIENFWEKIKSEIKAGEKRLENKIEEVDDKSSNRLSEIENHLIKYKKEKHDLADINSGYEGAMPLILEALKSAEKIISNDKKRNK